MMNQCSSLPPFKILFAAGKGCIYFVSVQVVCASLLVLVSADHNCFFLCNPPGDSLNQGKIRKLELYHSCSILGIPRSNVILIEDIRLRDGLHSVWPADVVAEYVSRAIDSVCPDKVCSFLMPSSMCA